MPIFTKGDKKVFFIHIPRTSGRYIRDIFVENGYIPQFNEYVDTAFGFEIPHLFFPLYNVLPVSEINHFTVVRNPLNRFKSCAKAFLWKYNLPDDYFLKEKFTLERFNLFVSETVNDKSTFFLPQSTFLSEKTNVWKQEDGFENNFSLWCKEKHDIIIEVEKNKKVCSHKKQEYDFIKPKISEDNAKVVKKFYERDYRIFEYDL